MNLEKTQKKMGFIGFFFKSCREEYEKYYSGKYINIIVFLILILFFIIGFFIVRFFLKEYLFLQILGGLLVSLYLIYLILELTIKFFSYYFYEKIKNNITIKFIFKHISSFLLFFLISLYLFLIFEIFYNYFVLEKNLDFLNTYDFYIFYVSLFFLLILKNIKSFITFKYITFFNFFLSLVVLNLFQQYNFFPNLFYNFYTIIPFYFIMGGVLKIIFYNYTYEKNKKFLVDDLLKTFKKTLKEKLETDDYQIVYKKYLENLDKLKKPNTVELLLDKPIDSYFDHETEKDILGHHKITEKLFTIIRGLNLKDYNNSYTIGLVGERGIGKSGIINMLNNDWIKGRNDMIFYEFSPWNYKKEDLINKFFTDLSNHLDIINFTSKINNYLKLIGSIEKVNGFGGLTEFLGFLLPEPTLDEIKKDINTKLENFNKKIIVSIDDLDRCEPDEIITMLNLVKNLGNFKNIIYVVSYDKENVLNVVKDKKFGDNYLDKIINTEVYIPTPTSKQVQEYFEKGLEKIFNSINFANIEIKNNLLKIFLNRSPFYGNLRLLKKYLNFLNLSLNDICSNLQKKELFLSLFETGVKYKGEIEYGSNFLYVYFYLTFIKIKNYNFYNEVLNNRLICKNNYKNIDKASKNYFLYKGPSDFLIFNSGVSNDYRIFLEICGIKLDETNPDGFTISNYDFDQITEILDNFIL